MCKDTEKESTFNQSTDGPSRSRTTTIREALERESLQLSHRLQRIEYILKEMTPEMEKTIDISNALKDLQRRY